MQCIHVGHYYVSMVDHISNITSVSMLTCLDLEFIFGGTCVDAG